MYSSPTSTGSKKASVLGTFLYPLFSILSRKHKYKIERCVVPCMLNRCVSYVRNYSVAGICVCRESLHAHFIQKIIHSTFKFKTLILLAFLVKLFFGTWCRRFFLNRSVQTTERRKISLLLYFMIYISTKEIAIEHCGFIN